MRNVERIQSSYYVLIFEIIELKINISINICIQFYLTYTDKRFKNKV